MKAATILALVLIGVGALFILSLNANGTISLSVLILSLCFYLPTAFWAYMWPKHLRTRALEGVSGGDPAIAVLDERLARGEITADQYRELRRELER